MADNTEEEKAGETQEPQEVDTGMSQEQSFAFWLVLLPFLAFACVQIYEFSQGPGTEHVKLVNAGGLVVSGIFVAYFVNALTQGADKGDAEAAEAANPEGSSS